jgi:hypothetical protein
MSSVLERMILRARSGLAGIEPLHRPRYAPTATAAHEATEWATATGERAVEHAPAPAPSARRAGRLPAAVAAEPATGQAAPNAPAPVHRPPDPSADARLDPTPAPRSARLARARVVEDIHGRGREAGAVSRPAPVLTPNARSNPSAVPITSLAPITPVAPEPDTALLPPAVAPVDAPAPTASRAVPAAPVEPAARQPQRPTPSAPNAEPAPARADITISIGHIEVRAAQVAERPRPPAFRPRVTLDDYLGRRAGESR